MRPPTAAEALVFANLKRFSREFEKGQVDDSCLRPGLEQL